VQSAQGVTTDTAHAVLADSASRAMAYVAMSRGRDTNQAYIYTRDTTEADHDYSGFVAGELHLLRRGSTYSAAHRLRNIATNDDRPRTMHAEAQNTDRELLPDTIRRLLDRQDQRLVARAEAWRQHAAAARDFRAAGEPMMFGADRTADRSRAIDVGALEL
jgi:hypothetical protein